jgi:DNA (cytosine-5)-methyltransferase 1
MRFVSLFAGVGGFDLGLEKSGHTCVGQVEIDKHAVAVLEQHWPDVPKHDDVRTAKEWADAIGLVGNTDIVCGGFPCQDVSVAGKRAGLAGERSGLFFDALEFAVHVKAKFLILENVPGLLSSNEGRDFGTVITEMANAGYRHIEWRVLDSQFFGVPQRRRRVFIVGHTGDRSESPILIEREGVPGNTEQIREKKQNFATTFETSVARMRGFGDYEIDDTASTLKSRDYKDVTDIVVQQES